LEEPLQKAKLEEAFEHWWPKFSVMISKCPNGKEHTITRTDRDVLEEILEHTRALRRVRLAANILDFPSKVA
jgi:hypothetical protein